MMRPFAANIICPKCSHDEISVLYHASVVGPECPLWPDTRRHGEHLDRRCSRCFNEWAELPLEPEPLLGNTCTVCGAEILEATAQFCNNCGARVVTVAPALTAAVEEATEPAPAIAPEPAAPPPILVITCAACGTESHDETAQFCGQCGARLGEAPLEEPPVAEVVEQIVTPAPAAPAPAVAEAREEVPAPAPTSAVALHPAVAEAHEESFELPPQEILTHKAHRSQRFYLGVFVALVVITIVEVGIFYVDVAAFRIPSLLLLSTGKFALVIMFFMHLKGDRRFFSMLFVGPVFIGAAVLVSLTGCSATSSVLRMPLTQISPKRVVAGLVALAGILALAACGGGAEGTPTPFSLGGGSQVSGFTPTPTASTEGVTPEAPTATPAETVSPGPSPTAPNGGGASLPIASIGNELRFDTGELTASAGSQVRVAFQNNATSAALEHNWVLIEAGTEDAVAAAGLTAGAGNDWIPKDDPNVIAFVPLIDGGASGEVSFPAPPPGTYAYICSFPGHSGTMRGVFEVAS